MKNTIIRIIIPAFLFVFINSSIAENVAANQPWNDPQWKKCAAEYKRVFPKNKELNIYRLINGKCGPSAEIEMAKLNHGACFMKIVGPAAILNSAGFEVQLVCMDQKREDTVCTNRSTWYNENFKDKVRNDKRCVGFPDLVSKSLGANSSSVPKMTKRMESKECPRAVRTIQRLEENPRFDFERSIRLQWQEAVDYAMKLQCNF